MRALSADSLLSLIASPKQMHRNCSAECDEETRPALPAADYINTVSGFKAARTGYVECA